MKTLSIFFAVVCVVASLADAASIYSDTNGVIHSVMTDAAEARGEKVPAVAINRVELDEQSNTALLKDLSAIAGLSAKETDYRLVGTNLTKKGSPIPIAADKPDGKKTRVTDLIRDINQVTGLGIADLAEYQFKRDLIGLALASAIEGTNNVARVRATSIVARQVALDAAKHVPETAQIELLKEGH